MRSCSLARFLESDPEPPSWRVGAVLGELNPEAQLRAYRQAEEALSFSR